MAPGLNLNSWGASNNYLQMPWMNSNYGMSSQYGAMPDYSLPFYQPLYFGNTVAQNAPEDSTTTTTTTMIQPEQQVQKREIKKVIVNPEKHGKVSFGRAASHILKGAGNFFKGMVCGKDGKFSLGRTLLSVGLIGLSIAVPAVGVGMLALGATVATAQIGHGTYKAITAKTDAQADAAYEEIGSGATGAILAFVGAKPALKSIGITPKGGAFRSLGQCFAETGKTILSPGKAISKSFADVKQFAVRTNVKANKINEDLYPIESKLQRAQAELAKQERRMDNIVGRQANPEKIAKYQEQIANLNAKKAQIESYNRTIVKSEVTKLETKIQSIKELIKVKEERIAKLQNPKKISKANKELEALNQDLKTSQSEYQTTRNYYKYDRLNEILESGTTAQKIRANTQAFFKNTSLAYSKYAVPAIYESQMISGHINRFTTPDKTRELYVDAITGKEIDAKTLTKEEKAELAKIKPEEIEQI